MVRRINRKESGSGPPQTLRATIFGWRPNRGGICHTKNRKGEPRNCYYRKIDLDNPTQLKNIDA